MCLPIASVQNIFQRKSHKAILFAWDAKSQLVYLDKRPYSAQFYSRGKARHAEAAGWQAPHSRTTLVMRTGTYEERFRTEKGWRVTAQDKKWVMLAGDGSFVAEVR
jgi:hypothetical protein